MNVSTYTRKDYENISDWTFGEPIQTQSKPVLSAPVLSKVEGVEWANFRTLFPLTARPVRKKMLSSNEAGDYNGIFSQISFFQRTPIERG